MLEIIMYTSDNYKVLNWINIIWNDINDNYAKIIEHERKYCN